MRHYQTRSGMKGVGAPLQMGGLCGSQGCVFFRGCPENPKPNSPSASAAARNPPKEDATSPATTPNTSRRLSLLPSVVASEQRPSWNSSAGRSSWTPSSPNKPKWFRRNQRRSHRFLLPTPPPPSNERRLHLLPILKTSDLGRRLLRLP